jgi:hypothetical protein
MWMVNVCVCFENIMKQSTKQWIYWKGYASKIGKLDKASSAYIYW